MAGELRLDSIRVQGGFQPSLPELRVHAIRVQGTYASGIDATVTPTAFVAGASNFHASAPGLGELRLDSIRVQGVFSQGQDASVTPDALVVTRAFGDMLDKTVIPQVLTRSFVLNPVAVGGIPISVFVEPTVGTFAFRDQPPTVSGGVTATVTPLPGIFPFTRPQVDVQLGTDTANARVDFLPSSDDEFSFHFQFPTVTAGDVTVYVHRGKRVGANRPAFDYPVTGAEARFARLLQDGIEQWQSVYRLTDGTYTDSQPDDYDRIDRVFYGGRDNVVTSTERAALEAAGFSEGLVSTGQVA